METKQTVEPRTKPTYRPSFAVQFLIMAVVAVVLNPDEGRHDRALRDSVAEQAPIASFFGGGRLLSWVAEYRSVGVASYTTLDGKVVSIGAFGFVYVRD